MSTFSIYTAQGITYLRKRTMDEEKKDPFIGVFDILFNGPRRYSMAAVRIVHWRMSANAELFYLIGEDGSIYNFNNIILMTRVGD